MSSEIIEHSTTFRRKTLMITQSFINDSFILDHSINGLLYDADKMSIYALLSSIRYIPNNSNYPIIATSLTSNSASSSLNPE